MMQYQDKPTTTHGLRTADRMENFDNLSQKKISNGSIKLGLIQSLCRTLEVERISYCHWKSNNALDRSASGENDLDLLVSREDVQRFTEILYRLEFKGAKTSPEKQMPGVLDYFGYDSEADKFVHVHAHYQLIVGHDMTKNYHLPIERPYLDSAVQGDLFKIPEPEFEMIVFVIRMILKHSTWDAILGREGKLKQAERQELAYLQSQADQNRVHVILKRHFPYVSEDLFEKCLQALNPKWSTWARAKTGYQLQMKLQIYARRSLPTNTLLKFWRRVVLKFRRQLFKSSPKYQLESGGAMLAIVGGDGAGKSTAIVGLHNWLSKNFRTTRVHMGKPSWSWTTITIRGFLKIGKFLGLYPWEPFYETDNQKSIISPEYPWLLREICNARDRYRTYRHAHRFAINGGIVIFDRFPLPQIQIMDGPQVERYINGDQANGITKFILELERNYYNQIVAPELIIVLRVNPEIAVQRKTDEDPSMVRERSTEIWEIDWERTDVQIIEARKSKEEVLTELKTLIWSQL
jgi:thymidylate kinase